MHKILSVIVAVLFAAASFGAVAQTKDVKSKTGDTVKDKQGQPVVTKEMKDKPKPAPAAAAPKPEKPAKPKTEGKVTTKGGGPVTTKDQKPVTTQGK